MTGSLELRDANLAVSSQYALLSWLGDARGLLILHLLVRQAGLSIEEIAGRLKLPVEVVRDACKAFLEAGLLQRSGGKLELTELGRQRTVSSSTNYEDLLGSTIGGGSFADALPGRYKLLRVIGRGVSSITFEAEQQGTYKRRTVKIFLPFSVGFNALSQALAKRAQVEATGIPDVVDSGVIHVHVTDGNVTVPCVVLSYVDARAKTFADFLATHANLGPAVFDRFIERVGGALAAVENAGLQHGDLHEGNILVLPEAGPDRRAEFWLIDFVGVSERPTALLSGKTDLENFRDHLLRATVIACRGYPGGIARYIIGDKAFKILEGLRLGSYGSFAAVMADYASPQREAPEGYFKPPAAEPFDWLRAEWIPHAEDLYRLFTPVKSRFNTIARFGNTWISGPRGCGKSHYLRVLAFEPRAIASAENDSALKERMKDIGYDFRKAFGVLFPCRLGEFKFFSPEFMGAESFDAATQLHLRHILILKIVNRTLETINEGLKVQLSNGRGPVLREPRSFEPLVAFLEQRLGSFAVVGEETGRRLLVQCLAATTSLENSAVATWHQLQVTPGKPLLSERDLDTFFGLLKGIMPDLQHCQFFILIDDASYGHVHLELQKILNSLVRAAQANHCFKITCEKFMYTLDSADGRALDSRHELTYVDLGEVSSTTARQTAFRLSDYMADVVDLRLRAAGYRRGIRDLLGRSQDPNEFLAALARGRDEPGSEGPDLYAFYGGWAILTSLAHGSIRTLLEMIEQIFKVNNVGTDTEFIPLKAQDSAIRAYSKRQLKALGQLPGTLAGKPLGRRLQEVISAVGKISRDYLTRYETGQHDRWYETITFERADQKPLSPEAQQLLEELIKFGLLLDDGFNFSRKQFGLSHRYDLNKAFSPAFRITYRVRNHIFLTQRRLEEMLLEPDSFIRHHVDRLDELAPNGKGQRGLGEFP